MENSNRPVQRVIPIRSEFQNRADSIINCQSVSNFSDTSCGSSQQYKLINAGNDQHRVNSSSVIESVPFVQQNVNIMNINLSNNALLQGVSQDPNNGFSQVTASPKTFLQLSDGRYVQIAQNMQPMQNQMPTTFLVQMPYKLLDQSSTNANQALMNKRFLLPPDVVDKSPQQNNTRFVTIGNPCNTMLIPSPQTELHTQSLNDYQRTMLQQLQESKEHMNSGDTKSGANVNVNGNIIPLDKYQETCDMLQNKKLLTKPAINEETVLVEFRLNQQKYQLRMTRSQKVDMEKLLISAGNQQRQMEILQVYQSEQRKNMQQRTSVVLNQIINKNTSNLICNGPQIQTMNMAKPLYPLNSVLMAVSQNQYNDASIIQPMNSIPQAKNIPMQSTVSLQSPNNIVLNTRLPLAQSSIMSVASIPREPIKEMVLKHKRVTKAPISVPANITPHLPSNTDMKPARSRRYNNMRKILFDDQNAVMTPNYQQSFEDLNDVAKRLLPYHILEECKDQKFTEVDKILTNTFDELTKRCTNLKRIASSLTINDMIIEKNSEQLLIKRMQLDLEQDVFDREQYTTKKEEEEEVVTVEESGHSVIIIEDSPPTIHTDDYDEIVCTNTTMTTTSSTATASGVIANQPMSFIDSMESPPSRSRPTDHDTDNMLDSLFNYDIQDISNDSRDSNSALDWNDPHTDDNNDGQRSMHDQGGGGGGGGGLPAMDCDDNQQSADPYLDAAIKSILF